MTLKDKLIYYWRYPVNRKKFPEIKGLTHKRYLERFVPHDRQS